MANNSIFGIVPQRKPKSSLFDLSHERKVSCNFNDIIPIYHQFVVPGDKFRVDSNIMLRMAPMKYPLYHRVDVYTHYFYIPYRIIWEDWKDFISGKNEETGGEPPIFPRTTVNSNTRSGYLGGSLPDYLGLPNVLDNTINFSYAHSMLPFRAYAAVWNEYYRDQNLQEEIEYSLSSGITPDSEVIRLTKLQQRCWEKDYLTSALPFAQKGQQVGIPVEFNYKETSEIYKSDGSQHLADASLGNNISGNMNIQSISTARVENLETDGVSVDINALRTSNRLQQWLERQARGGSRYRETIWNHFGVKIPDARAMIPEYLGGGKQKIQISEVLATAETPQGGTDIHNEVGTMAGHGLSVGNTNRFKRGFTEHGIILGLMSVMPRTAYYQGVHKEWMKFDKFEYYWPEFAHLGEEPVKNQEVWIDPTGQSDNGGTFGYQSRYAEYKSALDMVSGDFRKQGLKDWHLARDFATRPALNEDFVKGNASDRIFNVQDKTVDHLWCQIWNNVRAVRPMPTHPIPKL